jgi:hypothetical protein
MTLALPPASAGTTLHYRLDPGEPGLLRSSSAERSISAVSGQEGRNLHRLSSEAFLAGRVVISAGIQFTRGLEGILPVARAGQTTVVTKPDATPLAPVPEPRDGPTVSISRAPAPAADAPEVEAAGDPPAAPEDEAAASERELTELRRAVAEAETRLARETDAADAPELARELRALQAELRRELFERAVAAAGGPGREPGARVNLSA